MAAPAGEGGATARALRAESRTPPSALMERPRLPRRGGARSDTGPGGAGWAGRWLRSSAAPAPLNTPRPTWRTLNLDWPPLSANPSATAIPTLHRAGARAQRRPGERARGAGTGARARQRGESSQRPAAAGTGRCCRHRAPPPPLSRPGGTGAAAGRATAVREEARPLPPEGKPSPDRPAARPGTLGRRVVPPGRSRRRRAAGAARSERLTPSLAHLPLRAGGGGAARSPQSAAPPPTAAAAPAGFHGRLRGTAPRAPRQPCPPPRAHRLPLTPAHGRAHGGRNAVTAPRREELRSAVGALRCAHVNCPHSCSH